MSMEKAVKLVAKANYVVVFTGAGVSAESGIPTFRGKDGLWKRFRVEDLATPQASARNPRLVWEWYKWRMRIVFQAKPNSAHLAIARLEKEGVVKAVITQNVDGLHQAAGSMNVIELHGSIRRARCTACDFKLEFQEVPLENLPRCPKCRSLLRPDVVWFGETLPLDAWRRAVGEAMRCDCMIVVGTSGVVCPAAYIPLLSKERGALIIEVNVKQSALTSVADVFLKGRAGEILPAVARAILDERCLST